MAREWRVAIDIGGTFTDLLVHSQSGRYAVGKVLTDHAMPSRAVVKGLVDVLASNGVPIEKIANIIHATTLATNAIIERKGARTALLVTEGFRDILTIGREHRYDMYDLLLRKPDPLVPRRLTFPVPERVLADGSVLRPLHEEAVVEIAETLMAHEIQAVAVCLLHAYRNPAHELRVRDLLHRRAPGLRIALSHEVVAEQREYERAVTTVANAYILEIVDRYLDEMERDLVGIGHRGGLLIMLSNGALADAATARRFPVRLVESGPAAGALGAARVSREADKPRLLSFDMGGTTAKACLIEDCRPAVANELEVARLSRFQRGSGLPLKASSVELIEIGAGGGSIARVDRFGLLQVGPDSAGSEPGPACYGRGGTDATVTDADLLLGYLDPNYFLGGRMSLDVEAARRALGPLASTLDLDIARTAWTVHQVVNENMANAARIHAAERGRDITAFPLFAFGGAGPVHACRVAMALGIRDVIAPVAAGVGSTLGLLSAPLAFDFVRTAVVRVPGIDWQAIDRLFQEMENAGRKVLARAGVVDDITIERAADMRLVGQAHEITVRLPGERPGPGDDARLEDAFFSAYESLFGRTPPDVAMEVVNWRVRVSGPDPSLLLGELMEDRGKMDRLSTERRLAFFPEADGYVEALVVDRYALQAGDGIDGPAIVQEPESTLVLPPGSSAVVDRAGNIHVRLEG